jgi:glycosyltransferase involved in cell wall biosynthesis
MITVMFSTANGGRDLERMLNGLTEVVAPSGGWRLIAVDNASTDGSGDIMRSYAGRLPITVLTQPLRGKNRALNLALDQAEGDFYIFTDDDVVVHKDWLVKWRRVADAQASYDLFAGFTRPLWPHEPPKWILSEVDMSVVFATHDGMQEGPCSAACMYGTNMAVRAFVFQDGLRFDTGIGPDGSSSYAMGSDTEFALRLERQGLKCWLAAEPFVEHIVPPEHLEARWILRRGYRWGRGLARMRLPYPCTPRVLAQKNSVKTIVYPVLLQILPKEAWWRRQWQWMVDRGYEDGARENRGQQPRWALEK